MWTIPKWSALVFLWTFFLAGCQAGRESQIMTWLQPDNLMYVDVPAYDSTQLYSFQANPTAPTQLTLRPLTTDVRYDAEVRDEQGTVVATLGGAMRNAVMTLDPDDGLYEIAIQSKSNNPAGMLTLLLGSQTLRPVPDYRTVTASAVVQPQTNVQPLNFTAPLDSSVCSVSSNTGGNVNIRNGPGINYDVVGSLALGQSLTVTGQTQDGWYQATLNGQPVWVSGSVVSLYGACNQLPDVTPAQTVVSQPDVDNLQLVVDRDGWGNLSETLSYQEVDSQDLILMTVTNLTTVAPDNYREFSLTLLCSGTGVDFIRWGAPDQPTHRCGSSIVLPSTPTYNQQWIAVALPDKSGLSDVSYMLYVEKRKV